MVEVDEDVGVGVDVDVEVGVCVPDVGDDVVVGAVLPDKVVIEAVEVTVASLGEVVKLIATELPSC